MPPTKNDNTKKGTILKVQGVGSIVGMVVLGLNQNTIHPYMHGKFIPMQEKSPQRAVMK